MTEMIFYTNSNEYRCLENLPCYSVEMTLTYCGMEQCKPEHCFGPKKREAYVFHVVLSGKGKLELPGKTYELSAGDAFLIWPGVESTYQADKEDPWYYVWIGVEGYRAEKMFEIAGFSSKEPVRKVDCKEQLRDYIKAMLESPDIDLKENMRRNGYVKLFFSALMESYQRMNPAALQEHAYPGVVYVKNAIEYMNYHYQEKIKINELAEYIGVNRSYLTNMFKKEVGYSPQEYLVNLRIEKAKQLIRNTRMTISAIAEQIGYSDQLAFSKIFKQKLGMSPKHYRQTQQTVIMKKEKTENIGRI